MVIFLSILVGRNFWNGGEEVSVQNISFELDDSVEAQERKEEIANLKVNDEHVYQHQKPHFSFAIPEGHTVGEVIEQGGETIVVQDVSTGLGFQLFISPFDEDITLTQERIRQDLPGLVMESVQTIPIAERTGVAFVSQNQTFGTSREVWFVYGGYLYQMSTYLESEVLLLRVLETFTIEL